MSFVEREAGQVIVQAVPNLQRATVQTVFARSVTPGVHVVTDGSHIYGWLPPTYQHTYHVQYTPSSSPESMAMEFKPVAGESTQRIENFWAQFKRGVYGVYRHCKARYLQLYAQEFAWWYSHRKSEVPLFTLLLQKITAQTLDPQA